MIQETPKPINMILLVDDYGTYTRLYFKSNRKEANALGNGFEDAGFSVRVTYDLVETDLPERTIEELERSRTITKMVIEASQNKLYDDAIRFLGE